MRLLSRKMKIFLLLIAAFISIKYIFFRAPSEARMIARFHEQKGDFETLRSMLQQDKKLGVIGPDWIGDVDYSGDQLEQVGISQKRLDQYHALMDKIGTGVIIKHDSGDIRFEVFGGGFTDTSWGIGYKWSKTPPKNIVKSAYHTMPGRDRIAHSSIGDNWYIYHRR